MKLYINDEWVDFTIETETILSDIIDALSEQFHKSNGHILSITLNGVLLSQSDDKWKDFSVKDIQTLHIEAESQEIAHIKMLQSILQYLDILEYAAHNQTSPQNIEKEDVVEILNNIDVICLGYKTTHTPLQIILEYIITAIGFFDKDVLVPHSDMEKIFVFIRQCIVFRIFVLLPQKDNMQVINKHIKNIIETSYLSIVEWFVNNQDFIAMQYIIACNDIFLQWINLLHTPPEQIDDMHIAKWEALHKDNTQTLTAFFEEQMASIEVQDWITVGDLIEYEIAPRMLAFIDNMEKYYIVK